MLLLFVLGLVPERAAESPWALPLVADGPVPLAKVLMAELAKVQLEDKPWPRGTHSLRYHYLALSAPGPDLPQFLAVGYVDDHPFIQYDSHADRAEPQVPWMAPLDAQYWETETQKQRVWAKVQQVETWMVMGYHNHSSGMHSTQRMFGCEVQEDGHSSAFWQFGFDGQDHLSLDLETLSWVSAKHVAIGTKRWWEAERCYAEYDKAYLESICLSSLRRYLELGGQSFTRREPPRVHVTGRTAQAGGTMLKCWALGFYPQDISLSWWLGEEELALETEYVETRPSGDGTYQTWAAVWVPAGKEALYACHVQHSSLDHVLTVALELPSHQWMTSITIVITILLLVAGIVFLVRRCRQGGTGPRCYQSPDGARAAQQLC